MVGIRRTRGKTVTGAPEIRSQRLHELIAHDLGVVHYIADRIAVMYRGKIVETGTADEVFHSPKDDYTQRLLASIPMLNAG